MPLEYVDFEDLHVFARAGDAQALGAAGLITTVAEDVAAVAWSASGAALGLVIEGTATQSIANTSEPDTLMAATNGAITADEAVAPDGATTAAKYTENSSTAAHHIGKNAGISGNSGTLTNFSVFLKPNGRTRFQVSLMDFSALSNYIRSTIDLSAGTATGSVGGAGSLVLAPAPEAYPNGWWRVTLIGIPNAGGSGVTYPRIAALNASGVASYAGDGASGFFYWGHNATTERDQRSFIATTTAPKVRGADLSSLASLGTLWSDIQGTVYAKFIVPGAASSSANRTVWHSDDGTTDNSYDLRIDAGTSTLRMVVRAGGEEVANLVAGTVTAGAASTVAFSYIAGAFRVSLNGAAAVSDTSGAVPTGITAFYRGASDGAGSNPLNGILKRLRRRKGALNATDIATESAS